ncbi:MAG: GatB/YqeY domain-containing protein [Nitrospirae bacterium]|jgi:uncharacterized protein YqeY|nr:GatB/YqeY domain-containing protein [Nitrospirota bacterium]
MSLLKKLDEDLKTAMKASDNLKVSVLRMAKAAIKNKQIEIGHELSDGEVFSVFSTLAKQRRESIELFEKGGRNDLAEKEKKELSILQSYLPEQLSLAEIERIISKAILDSGASGLKDMGMVMRLIMPALKGVADGKVVNEKVKELLQKGSSS